MPKLIDEYKSPSHKILAMLHKGREKYIRSTASLIRKNSNSTPCHFSKMDQFSTAIDNVRLRGE